MQKEKGIVLLPAASLYAEDDFLEQAQMLLDQCIQTTLSQAKPGWENSDSDWYIYYRELKHIPGAKVFYDGLMRMKEDDIFFKPAPNPKKIVFVRPQTIWHFANVKTSETVDARSVLSP